MREIKFRAWDKDRKQMFVHSKWVEFTINKSGILTAKNYNRKGNEQQLITMQYTGLKDKDGKEIYEGDVLDIKYDSDPKDVNLYVPVEYNLGCFWAGAVLLFEDYDECRGVVGNIYENPELLKGE